MEDLQDFIDLIRDKMSSEYAVYDEQFPTDEESIKGILTYFAGTEEYWAVEADNKALGEHHVIGFISLNIVDETTRNLGYCIHSAYQRKGYATEAVSGMLIYAKQELKICKIVTGTAKENTPSVRLLEHFGFTMTGESQGSFVNDEQGNPIMFTGRSYEMNI